MNIKEECKRLWNWLYGKKDEVGEMDHRDVFMGHIVSELLLTSTHNDFAFVQLYQLKPIHPVDNRENTIKATQERAKKIVQYKDRLLRSQKMTKEDLAEILPSATYIRAIQDTDGSYATFEGNGRIAALKQVFSPEDNLEIEVDVYHPKKIKRTQKKLAKLRKMYGMKG